MKKLLSVYNICGHRQDNTQAYLGILPTLLAQKIEGAEHRVVISACKAYAHTIATLKSKFPSVEIFSIEEPYPIAVTFNNTVNLCREKYGEFDAYMYSACDVVYTHARQLDVLFQTMFASEDVAMASSHILYDGCYAFGLKKGGGRHGIDDERAAQEIFSDTDVYTIPVGRAIAHHAALINGKLVQFYGKAMPDVFAGRCSESIVTFLVAALKMRWVIVKLCAPTHLCDLDGPSICNNPVEHIRAGKLPYDHPFKLVSLLPIFFNDTAKQLGLGYEECADVCPHDPSQFDQNQYCINEGLKDYLKDHLFLPSSVFDYSKIQTIIT